MTGGQTALLLDEEPATAERRKSVAAPTASSLHVLRRVRDG